MKNRILFSLVVAVIPFFSFAQIDDMYFVPQKETKEQKEQQTRSQPSMHAISESVATTASNEHVQNNARDVDEYNRRYRWENDSTAANEEETANEENARADSIQGLEEDYQYTKRILRFNTPTIGVAVSSPLYWDLRYGPNSIYWDVYDDGFYAYDGDYTILFGGGEVLGMPDGMILGIGDHTGIIRIGDIPVMDGIHQDRLLDPV